MCKSATMQDIVAKDDVQLDEAPPDAPDAQAEDKEETPPTCWDKTKSFYVQNSFMVNVIIVIAIARAHASLTTKSYCDVLSVMAIIAVIWILLFTGLGLRTRELVKALKKRSSDSRSSGGSGMKSSRDDACGLRAIGELGYFLPL